MFKRLNTNKSPNTSKLPAGEYPVQFWGASPSPKSTKYNPQVFLVGEVMEGTHKGKFVAQCYKGEFSRFAEQLIDGYGMDHSKVAIDLFEALNDLKGLYAFAIVGDRGYVTKYEPAVMEGT